MVRGVTASRDGRFIASVSDDMLCKIWNAETGEVIHILAGHQPLTPNHYPSMLYAAAFSPTVGFLATADKVGHVVVWEQSRESNWPRSKRPSCIPGPQTAAALDRRVRSVAFSYDGKLLAIGGTGQINNVDHLEALARLEVFDWQENKRVVEHAGDKHKGLVERIEFSPPETGSLPPGATTRPCLRSF